ncbi:zinc finger domain-containing protein 19-like protein [Dinothrombium tinctorium]|uniref:Zinc finger domain-containing protein 19-like protein n=1 Tax=Dinothrombium tinctorium TaxID=1965070 RepID=A0A443R6S0_9ACAR|nr:zinc finger domain-containing protein 19-like protein [Dinothrombium tinctorium]
MENEKKHTGIYTCPTCNALFTCLQYYQQHVKQHAEVNGNKLLCCNHCRYSTDNQFHYNWHVMSHTGEPPHSCNVCKPPDTMNTTSNHIKSETETDDITYAMTGKRSVATATNDDIVLLPSSPMSCRLSSSKEDQNRNCSANQASSYASTTTQTQNGTTNTTSTANSTTSTTPSLPTPVENSGRGRGKGNRKSRTLNLLDQGVDGSVGGEMRRKFHCSHCGKSFKTKSHLQRHILTHTGEKPYHCNRCGSKFNQSSSLRNHIIAIHTKEYPHYCPQCGKGFLMPALLHKHLATSHRNK